MKQRTKGQQLLLFQSSAVVKNEKQIVPSGINDERSTNAALRKLKIQYGHSQGSYKRYPVLRIAGYWLNEFNFKIGTKVNVSTEKGRLTITIE